MLRAGFLLALLLLAPPASGHDPSRAYLNLEVAEDRRSVSAVLLTPAAWLAPLLFLPEGTEPTAEQVGSVRDRVVEDVLARIRIVLDGEVAVPSLSGLAIVPVQEHLRFQIAWTVARAAPFEALAVEWEPFAGADPGHVVFLGVSIDGGYESAILDAADRRWTWPPAPGASATAGSSGGFAAFLVHGLEHIFTGFDHIAFLVALLLVSGAGASPGSAPRFAGLGRIAAIVTAFTVAHSMTLAAAALGWVDLPSRWVESAIAASIVYVAVENLVRPSPRRRWLVAFGFGLVHGLGFASLLAPILPPGRLAMPLFAFNLGVELGQLAIVVLLYPVLAGLTRRRPFVAAGSVAIGALGAVWLVERVLDTTILGI